jgi:uncharacterized protein (DUF2147 family)
MAGARVFLRQALPLSVLVVLMMTEIAGAEEDSDRSAVFGIWATSGTMIEIAPADEGLSARIVALKHPRWREKDGVGVVGEAKTDLHNPDAAMRDRPFIGLEMLSDYQFRKGKWQGTLYLPSNGTLWKSTARVSKGKLKLRGFVGVSMFGKTQTFLPLATCNEDILRMIDSVEMMGTPCDEQVAAP